jgi:hypothetical protein
MLIIIFLFHNQNESIENEMPLSRHLPTCSDVTSVNISNDRDSVQIYYLPRENSNNNGDRLFEEYWYFLPIIGTVSQP